MRPTGKVVRWRDIGPLVLGLLLGIAALLPQATAGRAVPGDPAKTGYPDSMAATGDSITRAFNTGTIPFTDAPENSWSTGTTPAIASQYGRILAAHPAIGGHAHNDAVTGAIMSDLLGQVSTVNSQQVEYVTILLGANDACTATEGAMTPVVTYQAQFQTALATLSAGSPNARIAVSSLPDIYNLWYILKDNASARTAWSLLQICQSMLLNPLSTAQADVDRRNRVRQRVVDYNTVLAQTCSQYIHCRFDGNAVYNTPFVPADISTRDYFHPSPAGQTKLAQFSYAATFDFTDTTAPISKAAVTRPTSRGGSVALFARDGAGVAGIEYRINGGAYTRYLAPVYLFDGDTITYRAVDVNGNVEASHTLTMP